MSLGIPLSVPEDAGSVYTVLQSEDDFEFFWIAVGDADACATEAGQQHYLFSVVNGVTSQTICIKTTIPVDGAHSDVFRHAMDTIECLSNSSTFSKLLLQLIYDGKFVFTGGTSKEGCLGEGVGFHFSRDDDDVDDTEDVQVISYIINRSQRETTNLLMP